MEVSFDDPDIRPGLQSSPVAQVSSFGTRWKLGESDLETEAQSDIPLQDTLLSLFTTEGNQSSRALAKLRRLVQNTKCEAKYYIHIWHNQE